MKIQPCNSIYFNNNNLKTTNYNTVSSENNYTTALNIYPNTYYSPRFGATNIELISKIETALKANKPQEIMKLFEQMSDKAQQSVKGLVEKFKNNGLTLEKYLSACIKLPTLFYNLPETIEKNIKDLVKRFEMNGLTLESYLSACLKQPSLFCSSSYTIEKNVKGLVEKFKNNGLTLEKYLSACVKQPQLFYQSPETIEKNIKTLVAKFEANGLTIDNYLSACIKWPQLFFQSSETIEKNIKALIEKFKNNGLTLEKYIPACVKQASLFYQSPETIGEHINIIRFSHLNNNKEIDNESFWNKLLNRPIVLSWSSGSLLTKGLIIPKMFEGKEIPKELKGNMLKQKLEDYLKAHPKDKYTLNIKNLPNETGCTELLQNHIAKLTEDLKLPKDMFTIKINIG